MHKHNALNKKVVEADVVVIGAGLVGMLSAIEIAHEGKSVIVCEKNRPMARASALNAGGVRRIGRAKEEMPLSMAAHDIWRNDLRSPLAGHFVQSGHLLVAESEAEAKNLNDLADRATHAGLEEADLLSAGQINNLFPNIDTRTITLGLYCGEDGFAEPGAVCQSVQKHAQNLGVRILSEIDIQGVASSANGHELRANDMTIHCATVVNTAGYGGAAIAAMIGDHFELDLRAPIAMETKAGPQQKIPVVQTLGRKLTLKQLPDGRYLIGGGHRGTPNILHGTGQTIEAEVEENLATGRSLIPAVKSLSVANSWAGLEAYTLDGVPILGVSPNDPSFIHAFGFSGHGYQISPAAARVVADLAASRPPRTDISGLSARRFHQAPASMTPHFDGA